MSSPSLPSSVLSLPPNVKRSLESQGLPSTVPSIPPDGNDVPAPMRSDSEVHHDSDMDLEMPTDVPEDDERPNAFDDCEDLDDPDIDDALNQINSAANRDLSRQLLAMLHIMLLILSPPLHGLFRTSAFVEL